MATDDLREQLWRRAVEIHDQRRTRKHPLVSRRGGIQSTITPYSIAHRTEDALQACAVRYKSRPQQERQLVAVLREIRFYAPVLDVFTQSQPWAVSTCWGLMRLALEATGRYLEFGRRSLATLARLLRQISVVDQQLPDLLAQPTGRETTELLYACLIDYLNRVQRYCSASHWSPSNHLAKIGHKLDGIVNEIDQLLQEASACFTTQQSINQSNFAKDHARKLDEHTSQLASQSTNQEQRHKDIITHIDKNLDMIRPWTLEAIHEARSERIDRDEEARVNIDWLIRNLAAAPVAHPIATGTCEWLYEDDSMYTVWNQSSRPGLLHITGPSGCGKTTLAASDMLQTSTDDGVFLKVSVQDRAVNSHSRLADLIYNIIHHFVMHDLVQHSTGYAEMQQALTSHRKHSLGISGIEQDSRLVALLEKVLRLAPKTLLVVDGFDQVEDNETESDLLIHAKATLGMLRELSEQLPALSVVLLSRQRDWITKELSDCMRLDIPSHLTDRDIAIVVQSQTNLGITNDDIVQILKKRAPGDFLYATLLLKELKRQRTPKLQRKLLAYAPRGILAMYKSICRSEESRLSEDDRELRLSILKLATAAAQPMDVETFNCALDQGLSRHPGSGACKMINAADCIVELCEPFISIDADHITFRHQSARDFVIQELVSIRDANTFLLRICLSKLNEAMYNDLKYCARLVLDNLLVQSKNSEQITTRAGESGLYRHALLHWHQYAISLNSLDPQLWQMLTAFLFSNAFVSWSENLSALPDRAVLDTQIDVVRAVSQWYRRLPTAGKPTVPVDMIFVQPYQEISKQFADSSEDALLEFLALIRPADFLNLGGQANADFETALELRRRIVEGFERLLDPRDRNLLLRRRDYYQELQGFGRLDQAIAGYQDVLQIQRADLDENSVDLYITLLWIGSCLHLLTQFTDSQAALEEAVGGFKRLEGEKSQLYLFAAHNLGRDIEEQGDLETAVAIYKDG